MECALRSNDVERAANNRAVGAQPAPLVERFLTSLCGEWWSEPRRPQSLCALADECRAPRNAVATATGEGACFGWSCPRATRARSRRYVLRPPCLCHLLQPQTEVRIARSGCRRRGACHMPLPGGSTTRIKRCQSIWSNHTPRSMSIRRAMVHFGGMGSPNIYLPEIAATTAGPLPIEVLNGNVLGGDITPASLDGMPLPFMYCVDASRDIFVPGTYAATVTSNGTIHGTAVSHADQVAWLLGQYATDASGNATKTAALQAAIWEVMYGNQFTLHSPTAVV